MPIADAGTPQSLKRVDDLALGATRSERTAHESGAAFDAVGVGALGKHGAEQREVAWGVLLDGRLETQSRAIAKPRGKNRASQ